MARDTNFDDVFADDSDTGWIGDSNYEKEMKNKLLKIKDKSGLDQDALDALIAGNEFDMEVPKKRPDWMDAFESPELQKGKYGVISDNYDALFAPKEEVDDGDLATQPFMLVENPNVQGSLRDNPDRPLSFITDTLTEGKDDRAARTEAALKKFSSKLAGKGGNSDAEFRRRTEEAMKKHPNAGLKGTERVMKKQSVTPFKGKDVKGVEAAKTEIKKTDIPASKKLVGKK